MNNYVFSSFICNLKKNKPNINRTYVTAQKATTTDTQIERGISEVIRFCFSTLK